MCNRSRSPESPVIFSGIVRVEGKKKWTMHRVVASFLRCKSIAPDSEFADAFRWLHAISMTNHAYTLHLMKLTRDLRTWLDATMPQQSQAVEQAYILGADLVLRHLNDPSGKGARFAASQLLQTVGATEPVVERLGVLYSGSNETTATNIANLLMGMPYSDGAAQLFVKLLKDSRPKVRHQAVVNADQSARADVLAIPLLNALMAKNNSEIRIPDYALLFTEDTQLLDSALSRVVEYLNEGTDTQRDRALRLIGSFMHKYAARLPQGQFSYAELHKRLVRCTQDNQDLGIAMCAVRELGGLDNEDTYVSMVEPLKCEIQSVTQRQIQVFGEYLSEAQRPAALRGVRIKWLDDGGLAMSMSGLGEKPQRPERYLPLVRVVTDAMDGNQRRSALQQLLRTNSGKLALVDTINDLLNAQADALVEDIAEAVIRIDGDSVSGYWWRGQVRERKNQFDGAIADYSRVIELMPQYVDAFYRRALMLLRKRDATRALADLDAVARSKSGTPKCTP